MDDKVTLVTGATSGIGKAIALIFAEKGAKVVVAGRSVERGQETVSLIEKAGGQAAFIKCDVSKPIEIKALIEKTVDIYGRLDYAINNAGGVVPQVPIAEYTEENWDLVVDTHLKGTMFCMKYEIQQMLKQGKGAIVNMGSLNSLGGRAKNAAYVASKHGIIGLTKTAALECATSNIRVNAICPGLTLTEMTKKIIVEMPAVAQKMIDEYPMKRLVEMKEIAEAIIWLCSDQASYVTGHVLVLDGGLRAK